MHTIINFGMLMRISEALNNKIRNYLSKFFCFALKTDNFFSFQVNWKSYLDFLDYLTVSKI